MKQDAIIKQIFDPSIKLDKLSMPDIDEGTGIEYQKKGQKTSQTLGTDYPLIVLNKYVFRRTEIIKFTINQNDFLPTIRLKVLMHVSGQFMTSAFPKDGDIISVFINGNDDLFKPIRNDYLITDVSTKNLNNEGVGGTLTISGVLRIPKLYDEICKSYSDTSLNSLKQIAQDLNLGFATNESETNDNMNWLSPFFNYEELIKHITGSAWKNQNSFFNTYIDIYYNLNFVNVNKLFNNDTVPLKGLIRQIIDFGALEGEEKKHGELPMVLTTLTDFKGTNNYIQNYKVLNNSSDISKKYGYKFHGVFFEQNSEQSWDIFATSLTTEGSEKNHILLKGRANEDYFKSQNKKNWLGIQYSNPEHNVHDKFYYAKIHNLMNNIELEKINVEVNIQNINLNIFKYERLPCLFFIESDELRKHMTNLETQKYDEDASSFSIDNFYSGYYVVKGMIIEYDTNNKDNITKFRHKILLSRREWPNPYE